MATTISADIISKCVPAMSTDASRVDGLTLINIAATKPSELASIYTQNSGAEWRIIGNLLEADFRGKACQAKQNGVADFLKGNARVADPKKLSVDKMKSNLYEIRPYVMMEVKNPINNHRWDFTGGIITQASSGPAGEDAAYALGSRWKGKVTSLRNIPADVRWFNLGSTVTISGKSGSVRTLTTYKVLGSEMVSTDLWVYLLNISAHAEDPIYGLAAAKRGDPAFGVLTRGLPNVTTGESYCDNIPGLNTTQFRPFFLQSTRRTIREDDQYLKYAEMIRQNNPLFRTFGDVDSVEYTRQVMEDYDNKLADTFFHNPALANQTPELYPSLEKVAFFAGDNSATSTFTFEGRYQTYRSNATGYLEQLAQCEGPNGVPRLVDQLGQPLKLTELHREYYNMLRIRKANGLPGKVLEVWMHSEFREKMINAYVAYFKAKSIDTVRINMDADSNCLGFTWHCIKLDWPNVELRLVSHDWFDDVVDDHKAAAALESAPDAAFYTAGNLLLVPDFSTTYRLLLDSGAVTMETGSPQDIVKVDASFLCGPLMLPKQRVRHWWEIFTTVVECPMGQIAYENFDDTTIDQS